MGGLARGGVRERGKEGGRMVLTSTTHRYEESTGLGISGESDSESCMYNRIYSWPFIIL